jgi:tetratricopeptide (TPR) repeat protein
MIKRMDRWLWIVVPLGMMVACAVAPPSGEKSSVPIARPVARKDIPPAAMPSPAPAIVALLNNAESYEKAGAYEQSGAVLERALRLEPRNAMLWHRLARVRLKQGQWQNAVELAAKSNSLAGGDADLRSWNWAVIVQAKEQQGDKEGAAEARTHLSADSVAH